MQLTRLRLNSVKTVTKVTKTFVGEKEPVLAKRNFRLKVIVLSNNEKFLRLKLKFNVKQKQCIQSYYNKQFLKYKN